MSERVTQICPANPDFRIAWYKDGKAMFYPPVCLAIVQRGTAQDVVYMEVVDNEILPVDVENEDFMGYTLASDLDAIENFRVAAKQRKDGLAV